MKIKNRRFGLLIRLKIFEFILKNPCVNFLENEIDNYFSKFLSSSVNFFGEFVSVSLKEGEDFVNLLFYYHQESNDYLLMMADEKFIVEKKTK